jgi:O-antigen biosynthesis protein
MDAAAPRIVVERLIEPYTGLPLIGVGGDLPAGFVGRSIAINFDDERITTVVLTATSSGASFGTHVPLEQGIDCIRVMAVNDASETLLHTVRLADVGARTIPDATVNPGIISKLFGAARRAGRTVITGEILSHWRWRARIDRFSIRLLRIRQRLRHIALGRVDRPCSPHDAYVRRTHLDEATLDSQRRAAAAMTNSPTISILMPVYNVEPKYFLEAVESVRAQTYPNWQLCIADDASTRVDLSAAFDRLPDDPRIRMVRRPVNGHICAASNSAADLATGAYVALLDHDDSLAPNALFEVARAIAANPTIDLLYSDEDKIDAAGHRYDPQHKPEFSPELLLSYNYFNHLTVVRRSLFEAVGRFRIGFEGSQDHDLLLRVTERTSAIHRIPRILYHWRSLPTSTASSAGVKTYVHVSGRKAVADALARRRIDADLVVPPFAEALGLPILALEAPSITESMAIIVFGDAAAARATLTALADQGAKVTPYLVLDATAESLNRMAAARTESVLVFIAAGCVPKSHRWLHQLLAYLRIDGVGAVGGVQSMGDAISYYFYGDVACNVSTFPNTLLATRRETFERAGGFDADRYPSDLFAEDYCHRIAGLGERIVRIGTVTYDAPAIRIDPRSTRRFMQSYGAAPVFNPNLIGDHTLAGDWQRSPIRPSRPLRIAAVAHNLNSPEGAPRYLSDIVLGLSRRGATTAEILSPTDGAGATVYRSNGMPVTVFDAEWSRHFVDAQWSPRSYEAAVNRLMTELERITPDVVIANTLLTFPVIEAAARLKIPSVWIIHESYSADVLSRIVAFDVRNRIERAFRYATRIIPASHDTARLFSRCDVRHNIHVIHNGIDRTAEDSLIRGTSVAEARRQVGFDNACVHIISVGTICERKGQHTLVEAMARVVEHRRDVRLHLIGDRPGVPYGDYVRHLITRRGLDGIVMLVPETDRVPVYLRAADIFAFASHMETYSRSILEAMAFGLPIVSTPCHGVGEQVVWGQNALMFAIGDADACAANLLQLVSNSEYRLEMAAKSRAVSDLHDSFETMLDRYQAVIQQAAGLQEEPLAQPVFQRRAA